MTRPDDSNATANALSPTRRWGLVIAIGIVGCLVAIPFRRAKDEPLANQQNQAGLRPSRFAGNGGFTTPTTLADEPLPPAIPFAGQERQPEPLPEPEAPSSFSRSTVLPPAIPATYEPLLQPQPEQPDFLIEDGAAEAANILPQHLRALSQQQRWPLGQRQTNQGEIRPRSYRIRDGDTLASIAQRYLGDYRRGNEIFELNRDRLARPDMLPLGESILLPNAVAR